MKLFGGESRSRVGSERVMTCPRAPHPTVIAVSVCLVGFPAFAGQVVLKAPISQFGPGELGGIRTIVRYGVARPDREESRYLLLGEGSGSDAAPTQIQVQGVHGDDVVLSDVEGADCTLARTAILRRGAEVVLLWAVRSSDVKTVMAGGNALPGPMHIYAYRRHEGGNGESSPIFEADAEPIRTAAVCSSAEVQGVIDAAARGVFADGARR